MSRCALNGGDKRPGTKPGKQGYVKWSRNFLLTKVSSESLGICIVLLFYCICIWVWCSIRSKNQFIFLSGATALGLVIVLLEFWRTALINKATRWQQVRLWIDLICDWSWGELSVCPTGLMHSCWSCQSESEYSPRPWSKEGQYHINWSSTYIDFYIRYFLTRHTLYTLLSGLPVPPVPVWVLNTCWKKQFLKGGELNYLLPEKNECIKKIYTV